MKVDNLQILDRSIFEGKNVVIVGNGGNLSDYDQMQISNADLVIRFNNYATRSGLQQTNDKYKCDVLFTTMDQHSTGCKPKHLVIGVPFPFHAERIIERLNWWYGDSEIHMVNPYWNLLMCRELNINSDGWEHPFPSIGFTCLWHLHRMKNVRAYVCGFNWYFDWETKLCQGEPLGNKDLPKNWNHNYHGELAWIIKNLINVNFSTQCKLILNYAKPWLI